MNYGMNKAGSPNTLRPSEHSDYGNPLTALPDSSLVHKGIHAERETTVRFHYFIKLRFVSGPCSQSLAER